MTRGKKGFSLDPQDWPSFRKTAHEMLDIALNHLENRSDEPAWREVPDEVKQALRQPLPLEAQDPAKVGKDICDLVMPYGTGNTHPRFFGWVHGSGTPGGIIAEMMAAALNANLGGRDHAAIYVERQVVDWCRDLFSFPENASGLVVSGTSMATLIALKVARDRALGQTARAKGLQKETPKLVAYASTQAHACIAKTLDILGLGQDCLRAIPVNGAYQMNLHRLEDAIEKDLAAGNKPFCIVGTAGSVNVGAIDDLAALAQICKSHDLWFHIDGAFGALGILSDEIKPKLRGMDKADSLAFDFHKWMHVNYDAGFVLLRDGEEHRRAFSSRPDYLAAEDRGLAGGNPWPCEYGVELSRGFRALKIWFQFREHGLRRIGEKISDNCAQARYLASLVDKRADLQLLAPVNLNIVCFRYHNAQIRDLNAFNRQIVITLQERGIAAPSTTMIGDDLAIRVNITNHRSRMSDFDLLVDACMMIAGELEGSNKW